FGHRRELAPQLVECVAPQPARTRLQTARVDDMRGADLGDVHLQARMLAHERPGRAGVVEADVGEKEVPDVGEPEPTLGAPRLQRVEAGRGPTGEERGAVLRLEQVGPDDAGDGLVVEVDRGRHARAAERTSAASRSATRSSADSIPTERRTRFAGVANGASA